MRMEPHKRLCECLCKCGYKTALCRGQRPYLQGLSRTTATEDAAASSKSEMASSSVSTTMPAATGTGCGALGVRRSAIYSFVASTSAARHWSKDSQVAVSVGVKRSSIYWLAAATSEVYHSAKEWQVANCGCSDVNRSSIMELTAAISFCQNLSTFCLLCGGESNGAGSERSLRSLGESSSMATSESKSMTLEQRNTCKGLVQRGPCLRLMGKHLHMKPFSFCYAYKCQWSLTPKKTNMSKLQ